VASQMEMASTTLSRLSTVRTPFEKFGGIDLRAMAIQHALDEHGEGDGRGEQNQPDHRAAIGQKRWHEVFYRRLDDR